MWRRLSVPRPPTPRRPQLHRPPRSCSRASSDCRSSMVWRYARNGGGSVAASRRASAAICSCAPWRIACRNSNSAGCRSGRDRSLVGAGAASDPAEAGVAPTPKPAQPLLKPGARLVREWHGRTHAVIVLDDAFEFEGNRYRSLTQIAREITGAHWSGPRFFGLANRKSGAELDSAPALQDDPEESGGLAPLAQGRQATGAWNGVASASSTDPRRSKQLARESADG